MLHAAYNDAAGVTAKFNLNLLVRINRELGGDFDLARSAITRSTTASAAHRDASRQPERQKVRLPANAIEFRAGETIHTESSYKYTIESLGRAGARLRLDAGDGVDRRQGYFSVHALHVARR